MENKVIIASMYQYTLINILTGKIEYQSSLEEDNNDVYLLGLADIIK